MSDEKLRKIREIYEKLTTDLKEIEKYIKHELDKPFDQIDRNKIQELLDQMTKLRKKSTITKN
jgi:hypothetical protein